MSDLNDHSALIGVALGSSPNALSKLNTPPSLILFPSSADSPSETTPSALNPSWKSKGSDNLFDDNVNPNESASTPSTHSTFEETNNLSRVNSSHSRGSSTTSSISAIQKPEAAHRTFPSPLVPDTATVVSLSSERPHSFSGGISQSDLRRLQSLPTKGQPPSPISTLERLDGPRTSPPRENAAEVWAERLVAPGLASNHTPRFPTLGEQPTAFPSIQGRAENGSPPVAHAIGSSYGSRIESSGDLHSRAPANHSVLYGPSRIDQNQARSSRQSASYPIAQQQELIQHPYIYPTQGRPALDRPLPAYPQGYYDLGSPVPLRRDQQVMGQRVPPSPHAAFTGVHPGVGGEHPTLRNTMSMSLLNGGQGMTPFVNMNTPANGLYTPPPNSASPMTASFPGFGNTQTFYPPPTATYNTPDALSNAMSRMTIASPYNGSLGSRAESDGTPAQPGPSANNRKLGLYKTELCRSWEEKGSCRYGAKCQFAHSDVEIRKVARHPKYKTEICRTFWVSGSCPYGKRCCFIHTELKNSTNQNETASGSANVQNPPEGNAVVSRDRSLSNASGAGSQPGLLTLLPTRGDANIINLNSPSDKFSASGYPPSPFGKPGQAPLKVDTSFTTKTNRPLTSNPSLIASDHQGGAPSPVLPATAGPDFGRQAAARHEVVGYNTVSVNQRGLTGSKTNRDSQLRHSFNGTEIGLSIPSPTSNPSGLPASYSPITPNPAGTQTPTNNQGHQRSGSAGQWPVGNLASRSANTQHIVSPASYLGGNEGSSPWGGLPELSIDRKRLSGTWL